LGDLLLAAEEHSGILLIKGDEAGIGADTRRDREPVVGVEPRTIERLQELLPSPVVAVPQTNALAFMQDWRRPRQVVACQVLGLDGNHVLAAEGGGPRLGETPWRGEPVA